MNRGYVKLYRKSLDSGLIKNHKTWVFFTYCLLKASHKNHKVVIGRQEIILQPGQFVFGRRVASGETGLTEREIRTALRSLTYLKIVTSKTTNKYSIITIINWDTYQADNYQNDQHNDQKVTSKRPHTRTEECKEDNNSCPHQAIVDLYHEILPELRKIKVWSEKRKSNLRARWNSGLKRTDGTPINSLEYWRQFFEYVSESDFLMGRSSGTSGKKPFVADLEWLLKESNFVKVIEGRYH